MVEDLGTLLDEKSKIICLILFATSFLFCFILTRVNKVAYISKRAHEDLKAVQSSHTTAVSRIGGLSVFACLVLLAPFSSYFSLVTDDLFWLTISVIPLFLAGFFEDLGFLVSPGKRLAAACISSLLVILIFDVWVTRLDIPFVDSLFSFPPLAIIFTIFAAVGVSHSFNLIDGLNGFSSYVTISIAFSLSLIALDSNQNEVALSSYFVISIVLGFMVLNFPKGKIFLGDAGAYMLGHILVWLAIFLVNLDKSIHSFAILLIFFWPVADTLLAIWRRWKLGGRADRPDRLHFHQLTMRFLEIRIFRKRQRNISNPIATCILVPFVSTPQVLGVVFARDPTMSLGSVFAIAVMFTLTYFMMIKTANHRSF